MRDSLNRRQWLHRSSLSIPIWLTIPPLLATDPSKDAAESIVDGDLKATFRDNTLSPKTLSGIDSLFHLRDRPEFDAFDPETEGASAGLNFEHIISGHKNDHNSFTPRRGPFRMEILPSGNSVKLIRRHEDDPWAMSSSLQYTVKSPSYIDVDFRCVPRDRARFGERGYAILFFANYMNDVEQIALHFRGVHDALDRERWIAADAPPGHADWNQGGTYRSIDAADLQYDADHNFKLNNWSYDWPRFTHPFYYGRAANGMTLMMMFDKMYSDEDEIRFSLFKFKLRRFPRPAWDFQYVIRQIQQEKEYGFRARLVWKRFINPEDCLNEYETWRTSL